MVSPARRPFSVNFQPIFIWFDTCSNMYEGVLVRVRPNSLQPFILRHSECGASISSRHHCGLHIVYNSPSWFLYHFADCLFVVINSKFSDQFVGCLVNHSAAGQTHLVVENVHSGCTSSSFPYSFPPWLLFKFSSCSHWWYYQSVHECIYGECSPRARYWRTVFHQMIDTDRPSDDLSFNNYRYKWIEVGRVRHSAS